MRLISSKMSFVEGFYSFNIQINDPERNVYEKVRIKTARHPHESLEHLFARIIAFSHCYEAGVEFTRGMFDPREPTIWKRDFIGHTQLWVHVGSPARESLQKALRGDPNTRHRIYFYMPEDLGHFCQILRGSKTNWVENVKFFQLDPELLESLAPLARSSSDWSVTNVDNTLYLQVDGREFVTPVRPLDIWDYYQLSINNIA